MAGKRINISHPKTDENYAVTPKVFHDVYEPQGFKAGDYVDGTPYEAPKKAQKGADDTKKAGE